MKAPVPLNDLDKAIMAFQRSQAALPFYVAADYQPPTVSATAVL